MGKCENKVKSYVEHTLLQLISGIFRSSNFSADTLADNICSDFVFFLGKLSRGVYFGLPLILEKLFSGLFSGLKTKKQRFNVALQIGIINFHVIISKREFVTKNRERMKGFF